MRTRKSRKLARRLLTDTVFLFSVPMLPVELAPALSGLWGGGGGGGGSPFLFVCFVSVVNSFCSSYRQTIQQQLFQYSVV